MPSAVRHSKWVVIIFFLLAVTGGSQPALTPITDTVVVNGKPFNGSVAITWNFSEAPRLLQAPVPIANGILKLFLSPSTTNGPGSGYEVVYTGTDGTTWKETWIVPPSTTPLHLAQVRVSSTQPSNSSEMQTGNASLVISPQVILSKTAINWGNQIVGHTSQVAISVTNAGTEFLSISGITLTGQNATDFALLQNCGAIISAGTTCTILVSFTPSILGSEAATIVIVDSALGSPQVISLSGSGRTLSTSGGPIIITPRTSAATTEGTTQQFEANIPVTWSLAPGSVGSIDPVTGVYTAPAAIAAANTVNGCQAVPNDDVFATRIDSLPVHANSATWIAALVAAKQGIDYEPAWGVSTFDANTPTASVKFNYTAQYNGLFSIPVWPQLRQEGGNFAVGYGGGGGDHHFTAVNLSNCSYEDIYNYVPGGLSTSGIKYSGLSWALPNGGTDAAGMELSPVTLHLAELEAGHINHPLRFSISNNYIQPSVVWPASANAYPYSTNMLPYGTRLRLKRTALNPATHTAMAQTLLAQLMQQGIILADGASYMSMTVDQDLKEDPQAWAAIEETMQAVNAAGGMGAFEVVDESSLELSAGSGAVNPANAHVAPNTYAEVVATDASNSTNTAKSRILFQGVGIGVPDAAVAIPSGATVQLQGWTTGTRANSTVQWQTNPSVGTLTESGSYTAPKVSAPTRVILTAYSAENPAVQQPVAATILPLASDGSLRVADIMGSAYNIAYPGSTISLNGFTWWTDPGFFAAAAYSYCDWGGAGGFNGGWCTFGEDGTHDFLLSNGNYKITLSFATPSESGRAASWNIGAQGQWTQIGYNVIAASNNSKQLATVSLPAQVTDNHLSFTISDALVTDTSLGVFLSGFAIAPDASGPHLTLSDAGGNTVTSIVPANTTMQFNAVGWYMSNAVTWSLSSQLGSISSTGLYTAPITPQSGTVTLTATSAANPTQSASMTINLVKGKLAVSGAASVARGLSAQYSTTLNGGAYSNVTWAASLGSISNTGLYTAPDPLAANTTAIITATSKDDPSLTATSTITLLASIAPIRINSGDWYANVTDAQGNVWLTDRDADVGMTYHASPFIIVGTAVDGTTLNATSPMAPVYNSSRYSSYTPKNQFNYNFNMPNGNYAVTLLFANYSSTPHSFLFNVTANGNLILANYDPDANGFQAASSQSFNVTVKSQMLTLNFAGIGSKIAGVSGIQIVPQPH